MIARPRPKAVNRLGKNRIRLWGWFRRLQGFNGGRFLSRIFLPSPMCGAARLSRTRRRRQRCARETIAELCHLPKGAHAGRRRAVDEIAQHDRGAPRKGPTEAARQAAHASAKTDRHARSSSAMACSRRTDGNCRRNSSSVSPPSRWSNNDRIGTRVPWKTGVPPRMSGSRTVTSSRRSHRRQSIRTQSSQSDEI